MKEERDGKVDRDIEKRMPLSKRNLKMKSKGQRFYKYPTALM